jgi:polyphosphate glucokinase
MVIEVTGRDRLALGVDVGGTMVKAGVVDLTAGTVVGKGQRLATPQPPTIDAVIGTVAEAVARLGARAFDDPGGLPLGIGLSGDVRDGTHTTGVNLDPSWVGAPARSLLEEALRRAVRIINDADAAGIAEMRYGAGRGINGVVVMLTFGTGIGSAVFVDGHLLPNSGFGQFPFHGTDVELLLSAVARERRGLSWIEWASELNEFLRILDGMLRPDQVIVGGGASEAWQEYAHLVGTAPRVVRAQLGNAAGIVGAAAYGSDGFPGVVPGSRSAQ